MKRLLGLSVALLTLHALADEYHYNNLLIGKNAVGLGGAFTAVANDLSTVYYNPAGLADIGSTSMASINTFSWETTEFKNVFGNGDDFERNAFSVVPGFFGVSQAFENWTLAAALMVTDYSRERSDSDVNFSLPGDAQTPPQQQNQFATIDIDNSAYQLNFSFGRKLDEHWSIGGSLALEYRTFETYQASGAVITQTVGDLDFTTGFIAGARFTDTNLVLFPSIGALYRADNLALGMKISKGITLNRDHKFISSINVAGIPPQVPGVLSASRIVDEACCEQRLPLNVNLGSAYRMGAVELSFDIHYFAAVDQKVEVLEKLGTPITRPLDKVINYALGMSYQIDEKTSIQLGVFTDNSMSIIDTEIPFQRAEQIDLKGISAAYNTQVFDFPVTFGLYYKFGEGKVRLADIRIVDEIVGLPVYPPSENFDIGSDATKRSFVGYFSVNF